MTETNTTNTERLSLSDVMSNGKSAILADSLGGLQANPDPDNKYSNDQYDAFRHAYASARYTERFGSQIAEFLGKSKELFDSAPTDPEELKKFPDEQNMDNYNNQIGRQEYQRWKEASDAGKTKDTLEKWIYDRVKERKTINDLNDTRKWKEPPSTWDKFFNDLITDLQNLFESAKNDGSPLILDLDGDGIETLGTDTGIHFDHDGNQFSETSGWVGKDDGLLVWDKNANGQVDSGAELFGNNTELSTGSKAANGFAALTDLDDNHDGKLDGQDSAFTNLRVWKDGNSDGLVQSGELLALNAAGVESLNTNFSTSGLVDANGNQHRQVGSYTKTDGSIADMTDVWFERDTARTIDQDLLEIDATIAAMPDLAGFGNVHSLHQALARDNSGALATLVQQFINSDQNDRAAVLDQLIYAWTGVTDIDSGSRGPNIDARKLASLDAFMGEPYRQFNFIWTPGIGGSRTLNKAYNILAASISGRLLLQTTFKPLLDSIQITISENSLTLDLSPIVATLQSHYDTNAEQGSAYMFDFGNSLKVLGDAGTKLLNDLRQLGNFNGKGYEFLLAHIGNQLLLGDAGNNNLFGGADDDAIIALAGNDNIYGNAGNDILNGGAGNDYLNGGTGSDIYLFGRGSGQDRINNYDRSVGKQDTIQLDSDILESDIVVARSGHHLVLSIIDTTDTLTVSNYFMNDGVNSYAVEAIKFADGTNWDLETLKSKVIIATASNDYLQGYATADSLNGLAGNDTLFGNAGNDTLDGGADNDYVDGGDGDDQLEGGLGNDILSGGNGNDMLSGGEGNDNLNGNVGNDILNGGAGNDYLNGGTGSDIYLFGRGSGQDRINNYDRSVGKQDAIQLDSDILKSDIVVARSGHHLVLSIIDTTDTLTVSNYFMNDGVNSYAVEAIKFADGTNWDLETLKSKVIIATASNDYLQGYATADSLNGLVGNDTLFGNAGNDTLDGGADNDYVDGGDGDDQLEGGLGNDILSGGRGNDMVSGGEGIDNLAGSAGDDILDGGAGNDYLNGGTGSDTYIFNLGNGRDVVTNYESANNNSQDILKFGEGISANDLWFSRKSNNLVVDHIGSDDQVQILNWFSNANYQIEQISVENAVLHSNQIISLVNAMSAFNAPTGSGAIVLQDVQEQLAPVLATSWTPAG